MKKPKFTPVKQLSGVIGAISLAREIKPGYTVTLDYESASVYVDVTEEKHEHSGFIGSITGFTPVKHSHKDLTVGDVVFFAIENVKFINRK